MMLSSKPPKAPGDGFILGNHITFQAVPYPLPGGFQDMLKNAAKGIASAIPEGKPAAMRALDDLEKTIRQSIGETVSRPEFLTMQG